MQSHLRMHLEPVLLTISSNSGSSSQSNSSLAIRASRCSGQHRRCVHPRQATVASPVCTTARELLPPWTTSITPSTIVERMEASVNEIAGGESIMMCANRSLKRPSSLRISSEPSSSAGFGGTGPEVKTFRLGNFACSLKQIVEILFTGQPRGQALHEFGNSN